MKQTELFNYTDYRSFLQSYGQEQKVQRPNWSLSKWAKELGFSSTAVLTNIINGKRHPGDDSLRKFSQYFNWNPEQDEYFKDMVRLQKVSGDPSLSSLLIDRMQSKNPNKKFKFLSDMQFKVIAKPVYPALRELINMAGFVENVDWIFDRLKIKASKPEIRRALADLEDLNLITRDHQGKLISSGEDLDSKADVSTEAAKQYLENMADEAKASVRATAVLDRELSGMSFCMDERDMELAKSMIRKFRKEFLDRFDCPQRATEVYQLNLQLFPLTEDKETGVKK